MREFVIPILKSAKDSEGEYKPEFVKQVLKADKEKANHSFNSKTFLKLVS